MMGKREKEKEPVSSFDTITESNCGKMSWPNIKMIFVKDKVDSKRQWAARHGPRSPSVEL